MLYAFATNLVKLVAGNPETTLKKGRREYDRRKAHFELF
jgi:hypothetical protein